jgi:hypothetical protein
MTRSPSDSGAKKKPSNGAAPAPHSPAAEQAVLGGLLLDSSRLPEVAELLGPGYFYRADHRTIFAAITALASQGKPSDPVTVAAHLERAGELTDAGGLAYLSELARTTPTAANVRTYAETVCEYARIRQLSDLSADIARSIDSNSTIAEILPRVRSRLELLEQAGPRTAPPRRPLDWKALSGRAPPPRDWAVDHWLAQGHVALLAGAPGVGKTLLAQTLGTCLALGSEYIDLIPRPRRVLIWGGEDEDAELWRRQLDICRRLNVNTEALAGQLIVESYLSRDITLAGLGFGRLVTTSMMTELREQIGDYKADYVFLDSLARVYGGNENDRHQVTQFVSELAHACAPTAAGLCLLGHPGKAAGSEYSGSTAWEGSVRSRLYLGHRLPDQQPDDQEEAPAEDTVRYVCRRKSNYSAKDWRKLTYEGGVLVPEARTPQRIGRPAGEFGHDVVLRAVRKLADLHMHGNSAQNSPSYLPRLAKQYRMLEELSERQFAGHMRELIVARRLANQTIGYYANRTPRLGLVEVQA